RSKACATRSCPSSRCSTTPKPPPARTTPTRSSSTSTSSSNSARQGRSDVGPVCDWPFQPGATAAGYDLRARRSPAPIRTVRGQSKTGPTSIQGRLVTFGIVGGVNADAGVFGDSDGDVVPVFQNTELLEFFDLLEFARRQAGESVEQIRLVRIKPQVAPAWILLHPNVIDRQPEIPGKRHARTREIQRSPVPSQDHLHLIR